MTTDEAFRWLREHAPCMVSFGADGVHVRVGNGHPSATAPTLEAAVDRCALRAWLQAGVCPSIDGQAPYVAFEWLPGVAMPSQEVIGEALSTAWGALPMPATDETIKAIDVLSLGWQSEYPADAKITFASPEPAEPARTETWRDRGPLL